VTTKDFEVSTSKPPTRQEALQAADELEAFIGRLMKRMVHPADLPSRPVVQLISYARIEDESTELRSRLESKSNLLKLATSALNLSTTLAQEQDDRNASLRAALLAIANTPFAVLADCIQIARQAIADDDAQKDLDNTIAVDKGTPDLFQPKTGA
jgi:hypothetical protein